MRYLVLLLLFCGCAESTTAPVYSFRLTVLLDGTAQVVDAAAYLPDGTQITAPRQPTLGMRSVTFFWNQPVTHYKWGAVTATTLFVSPRTPITDRTVTVSSSR